jgi:hypothetical protein
MRLGMWAVAGVCALWAASPARAQTASTILGGPSPSQLTFRPVDLSNVIAPAPGIAAAQSRFSFAGLFSKLPIPGYPPTLGSSPLPSPGSFPSTKYPNYKMVGQPPFLLGKPMPNTFIPPVPIVPSLRSPAGPGSNN